MINDFRSAGYNEYFQYTKNKKTDFNRFNFTDYDRTVVSQRHSKNMRIYKRGKYKMTGVTTTASVTHKLGYVPTFLVFAKVGGSTSISNRWIKLPYFVNDGVSNPLIVADISSKNITFSRNFTSQDITFYYLIFREPIV